MRRFRFIILILSFSLASNLSGQQSIGLGVAGDVDIDGNILLNGVTGQPGQTLQTNGSGDSQWVDYSEFESLDVTGNANFDGNILLNGVAGQPGQTLQTNSSGFPQWVDFSEFDRVFGLYATGSGTFTVPSNVDRIGIELQGGGGAGSNNGGGAGGNYIAFVIDVTPGWSIPYAVGAGGIYNSNITGVSSTVTINSTLYRAQGGFGASNTQKGGSNNLSSNGLALYFRALGQPGTANDYSYSYGPNGDTIYKILYGSGGGTYPSYTLTPGGSLVRNHSTGFDLHITLSTSPFTFGSGGPANKTLNAASNGRGGYVRIHY